MQGYVMFRSSKPSDYIAVDTMVFDISFLATSPTEAGDELMKHAEEEAHRLLSFGLYDDATEVLGWLQGWRSADLNRRLSMKNKDLKQKPKKVKKEDGVPKAKEAEPKRRGRKGKFTDEQIRDIRRQPGSHAAVAEVFNTTAATISAIKSGRSYKHVAAE